MPLLLMTRNRVGLFALLAALICETAAALPFFGPGATWIGGQEAFLLHAISAFCTGLGASSFLTNRERRPNILGPATLFTLLAFTIPVAGIVGVLILTTILFSHRLQNIPHKPALKEIREPGRDTSLPLTCPLVTALDDLNAATLRATALGMDDMPPGRTRPLLTRLQKHPDIRVQLYAAGLINDQSDTDECRLAYLEEHARRHPCDIPTLLAIVESYLRLIDERLVPTDELPHTAQQAVHAAETVLAIDPENAVALQALTRFQLILAEFHAAYGTILRLHQLVDHRQAATDLLARLSYEYAAKQPAASTPPPPPQPKVRSRFS